MKKKNLIYLIIIFLLLICIGLSINLYKMINEKEDLPLIEDNFIEEKEETIDEETLNLLKEYDSYKEINEYFKGMIIFDSGLINLPFVKADDNDFFLRKDFYTMEYSDFGSVFMDYESETDSRNIVLYGHYVQKYYNNGLDKDGNPLDTGIIMFTPLEKLLTEEGYKENKTLKIVLEDEIRTYEVAAVYYCDLVNNTYIADDDLYYYLPEFSNEYLNRYLTRVDEIKLYKTDILLTDKDNFLTLQTCVEGSLSKREIVLCKLIKTSESPIN